MLEFSVSHQCHDENLRAASMGHGLVWAGGCLGRATLTPPCPGAITGVNFVVVWEEQL